MPRSCSLRARRQSGIAPSRCTAFKEVRLTFEVEAPADAISERRAPLWPALEPGACAGTIFERWVRDVWQTRRYPVIRMFWLRCLRDRYVAITISQKESERLHQS
jgi:hypothetical protein